MSLSLAAPAGAQTGAVVLHVEGMPATETRLDDYHLRYFEHGSATMMAGLRVGGIFGTPMDLAKTFLDDFRGIFESDGDFRYALHHDTRSGGRRVFFREYAGGKDIPGSGLIIGVTRDIDGVRSRVDGGGHPAPPGFVFVTSGERRDYEEARNDWYVYFATRIRPGRIVEDYYSPRSSADFRQPVAGISPMISSGDPGRNSALPIELAEALPEKSDCAANDFSLAGTGSVYLSNPNNADPVTVELHNLCRQSPVVLDGTWLSVEPESGSRTDDPSGAFLFDPNDARFDEVSAYYHVDNYLSMLLARGFSPDTTQAWKILAKVRASGTVTASTDYPTVTMYFSDPGPPHRNALKESAVIAHETMHVVMHRWYSSSFLGVGNKEHWAMGEAYADYFGLVYRSGQLGHWEPWRNPVLGRYYVITPTGDEPRDLTSPDPHYSEYGTGTYAGIGSENSLYDNSMIFSTALMDFDRADGSVHSVSFVLESLSNFSAAPDFLNGRDALIQALNGCAKVPYPDQEICCDSGICHEAAIEAFSGRGIGSGEDAGVDEPLPGPSENIRMIGAYPNPFRGEVRIEFETRGPSAVTVRIHDALGELVETIMDAYLPGGLHSVSWQPDSRSSGIYFVDIIASGTVARRSLTYLR